MKYLVRNKTSKNIVLLVDGATTYLYPRGQDGDTIFVEELSTQLKNAKELKFLQITKVDRS